MKKKKILLALFISIGLAELIGARAQLFLILELKGADLFNSKESFRNG